MNGTTTRDVKFIGPSSLASGTIRAGTPVVHVRRGHWASWIVAHKKDAPFFDDHDWRHRYVTVPDDAVIPMTEAQLLAKARDLGFDVEKDTQSDYYLFKARNWVEDSAATFDTPTLAALAVIELYGEE